ncbi:MAG: hypothetical protein IPF75_05235 [Bacteroidetes bacterium]|nr:hypothetical protein [Bacteroidota bacterium]
MNGTILAKLEEINSDVEGKKSWAKNFSQKNARKEIKCSYELEEGVLQQLLNLSVN